MQVEAMVKLERRKDEYLKLDVPNEATAAAIEEGRRIAADPNVEGYTDMDELRAASEE